MSLFFGMVCEDGAGGGVPGGGVSGIFWSGK